MDATSSWASGVRPRAVLAAVLAAGAAFSLVEDWRATDGLYFAIITATTVGFGDHAPFQTAAGKAMAISLVLASVGAFPVVLDAAHVALRARVRAAFGYRDDPSSKRRV